MSVAAQAQETRSAVALFIFNRPELTARVLQAIAEARPKTLFVIADGPREGRTGEADLCARARAIIECVDWPCQVIRHFSETNLGCKRRLSSGLDWVFSQVEEAIILEDDCLPATEFFQFCDEMLQRFRFDERVQMVRGVNLLPDGNLCKDSYYFSRFYNIWGWASWSRAWKHYDVEMAAWPRLRESDWIECYLPQPHMAPLLRWFFDETHAGRVDTWDYQWVLSGWQRNALAIVPQSNLVTNIGFGADATHMTSLHPVLATLEWVPLGFPLRHPAQVEILEKADLLEWERAYPSQPRPRPWQRLRSWLKRSLGMRTEGILS